VKRALLIVIPIAALVALEEAAGRLGPSPIDLPNDCGIVATEAASRLLATGVWTRIVALKFICDGQVLEHALVVWLPPTTSHVWAYDEFLLNGSLDTGVILKNEERDLPAVVAAIADSSHRQLLAAEYCK
jgi:hypothetical protein